MNDKMIRFLKSIGIEDIDRFDLDFELVARNANNRDRVDMFIIKKTPWNSRLLEEFMNGLNTISYQYMMRFSYETKPNADDAAKLFDDWFFSHNRYRTEAKCVGEDGKVTFYYKGENDCFINKEGGDKISTVKDNGNKILLKQQTINCIRKS